MDLVIGENTSELTIDSTVTLAAEAKKIYRIDARLVDLRTTVLTGQVLIEGTAHKQIYYVGMDDRIYHQAEDVPFSHFVLIPGAQPAGVRDMKASVIWRIEKVNWTLSSPTTVDQQIIAQFFVKVTEDAQINVVLSNTGPMLKAECVVGENVGPISPVEEVTLERPALKIREVRVEVRDITTEVMDDHVSISGVIHAQIFYVGTDQIAYHQAVDIPFTAVVEVPGAQMGMNVDVSVGVARVERSILRNGNTLQIRAIMQVFVKVTEECQVCVGTCPTGPLVRTFRVSGEQVRQAMVVNETDLPMPAVKVQDIDASVTSLECEVLNNKVVVQGVIHKQVYFVGPDSLLRHMPEDIPFSQMIDLPGAAPGMHCQVYGRVEHVAWQLRGASAAAGAGTMPSVPAFEDAYTDQINQPQCETPTEGLFTVLHQKAIVELFVKVAEECQLNVATTDRVSPVQEIPPPPPWPPICRPAPEMPAYPGEMPGMPGGMPGY